MEGHLCPLCQQNYPTLSPVVSDMCAKRDPVTLQDPQASYQLHLQSSVSARSDQGHSAEHFRPFYSNAFTFGAPLQSNRRVPPWASWCSWSTGPRHFGMRL